MKGQTMTKQSGNRHHPARLLASVAAVTLPLAAGAQQADDDATYLGSITLLGTGLETSVFENPSAVTVLDEEDLSRIPPARVADYLKDIPGVRVEEQGIARIRIRGEEARRTRILINGQAITDHTTYGPPVVVDPATVERIEVVRGASSVVSGQRAIGGTINIITKRRTDEPFEASSTLSYFGASDGWRISNSIAGREGGFTWRLNQGASEIGNRHAAGIGELVPSDVSDRNLSGYMGYEFGNHWIGLEAQAFDLSSNVYIAQPGFSIGLPKRDLRKINAFYEGTDLTPWLTSLKIDAYHQTIDREFRNRFGPIRSDSMDEQATYGINATAELQLTENSRTIVGAQYENDFLDVDATNARTILPPPDPSDPLRRYEESRIVTTSVFAQNEITLSPQWALHFGGRYYHVEADLEQSNINAPTSQSDDRFLVSAGIVWTPNDEWALRGLFSQGYNYPTLNQLFSEAVGGRTLVLPNPDLKAETANNFELGARFDNGATILDTTIFYTEAKDYIDRQLLPSDASGRRSQYRNISQAETLGLEIYAEHRLASGLTPWVSGALIEREFNYASGFTSTHSGTPFVSGSVGLRRDFEFRGMAASFDLFATGESHAKLLEPDASTGDIEVTESGGWSTVNLRGALELNKHATVSLQLNNIFNKQYEPFDQMPGGERSLDVVLSARF